MNIISCIDQLLDDEAQTDYVDKAGMTWLSPVN
jgi:hypothetical protein